MAIETGLAMNAVVRVIFKSPESGQPHLDLDTGRTEEETGVSDVAAVFVPWESIRFLKGTAD